jgi:SPP1 gp7 family putative phage head morphogenesis protein
MAEPISASDLLRDAILRRHLQTIRLTNGEAERIVRLLARTETELLRRLEERLRAIELLGVDRGPATTALLMRRIEELLPFLVEYYRRAYALLRDRLFELAEIEAEAAGLELLQALPRPLRLLFEGPGIGEAGISFTRPPAALLYAAVTARPFEGRLLREHFDRLPALIQRELKRNVRIGLAAGDSIDRLVRSMRTALRSIRRHQVAALVRTSVSHVAQHARREMYRSNSGVIEGYVWLATLDFRICPLCIIRDGKRYDLNFQPLGHSVPWGAGPGALHFNDRCTFMVVLKSWRSLGVRAKDLPPAARRALDGMVPGEISAPEWLKRQPLEELAKIFGRERARLFKEGVVSVEEMLRKDLSKFLTLETLRRRAA